MRKFSLSSLRLSLFISVIFLLLFIGFSYIVHQNTFVHIDFDTTVRLQAHISRRFIALFSFLSDIGKVEIVSLILLCVVGIYVFLFKKWVVIVWSFFLFGLMHFAEIYGKTFVHHLPPPHFMLLTHDVFTFPEFYVQATNSYPSGHAARALFLTVFLAFLTKKAKRLNKTQKVIIYISLYIYDITMLVSRVYLGEHWLSDVIGGSLLGAACGALVAIVL